MAAAAAARWECETCTYANASAMQYCEMCEMSKPVKNKSFVHCDLCPSECTDRHFHTAGDGPGMDLCPMCFGNYTGDDGMGFEKGNFAEMHGDKKARPKRARKTKLKKQPAPKKKATAAAKAAVKTESTVTPAQDDAAASSQPAKASRAAKKPVAAAKRAGPAAKPVATKRKRSVCFEPSGPSNASAAVVGAAAAAPAASTSTSFTAAAGAPEDSRRRADLKRAQERASAYAMGLDIAADVIPEAAAAGAGAEVSESSSEEEPEDEGGWDGPLAIAREMGRSARRLRKARRRVERNGGVADAGIEQPDELPPLALEWAPLPGPRRAAAQQPLVSLETLALRCLVANFDAVSALGALTPQVQSDIAAELCKHGAMTSEALKVLMDESAMVPYMPGWSELELTDCAKVEEDAMVKLLSPPVPSRLKKLHLKNCGRGFGSKAAIAMAGGCPYLTTLKLHGCYRLYDDDAISLLRQCPALTSLSLEHAAEITVKTIEALADKILPQLQRLSLSGCAHLCLMPEDEFGEPDASEAAEIALEQLARQTMPQLTALDLSQNPALSPATLSLILTRHGGTLKELNLLGCTELSAATLLEVATRCSDKLSSFKFIHQPPAAGAAVAEPNAERQAIADLGEAVEALAGKCGGSLTALALEGCGPLLSDAAMATVAERCGQGAATLQQLSLNNASGLTDRTLVSLATHTPGLTELDLSWCRKLTDEGLGQLTDKCEHLTSLKLWGCSQLTVKFLSGHRRHALQITGRPSRPLLRGAEL